MQENIRHDFTARRLKNGSNRLKMEKELSYQYSPKYQANMKERLKPTPYDDPRIGDHSINVSKRKFAEEYNNL